MVIRIGGKKEIRKSGRLCISIEADLRMQIKREDNCFVVYCPDLELSSYGDTVEEAQRNFCEVVAIFFDDIVKRGTVEEVLAECGWQRVNAKPHPKWVPPAFVAEKHLRLSIS